MHFQVVEALFVHLFCYCRLSCVKVLLNADVCQWKSLPRLKLKSFVKNALMAYLQGLFES